MDPSLPQYTHHEEGYGKNAAEQRAFAATALPVLKEALGEVNVSGVETFTVCDYGAADGMNSLPFMKACRDHLDAVSGNCDLLWVFNDLPNNNYNDLFKNINEVVPKGTENVFLAANTGSFFRQVLPKQSINLGLCLTAVHWLSERVYNCMDGKADQLLCKELSKKDWISFLLNRATEMRPGSQLVVTVQGESIDSKGLPFNWGALLAIKNLRSRRIITLEEYQAMTATMYVYRNEEDIRAPFEAGANYVATKAGLRLVKIERCIPEFLIFAEWEQSTGRWKDTSTRKAAVKKMTNSLKTFSTSFLSILSTTREKDQEREIIQAFDKEAEKAVEENLEKFQTNQPVFIVQIKKISLTE